MQPPAEHAAPDLDRMLFTQVLRHLQQRDVQARFDQIEDESLIEERPCVCLVLPIALHKANLPFTPQERLITISLHIGLTLNRHLPFP